MTELRRVVGLAWLVLMLPACGGGGPQETPPANTGTAPQENPAPGDHALSMEWNGKQRTFTVHAPPNYDGTTPLPLVVTMHQYPGTADKIAATSGMSAKADRDGFLVLYPEGDAGGMNAFVCCGSEDDVGFVKALIERMVARWRADPNRIYATGISNGGDMAFRLAVELPGTFAAIAPVSGGLTGPKATDTTYKPTSPVSVITFIGGKDTYFSQFRAGLTSWLQRLSCTETPVSAPPLPNNIGQHAWRCADGSDVVIYEAPEMGHHWPGAKQGELALPDAGIDATAIMWEFFKAHQLDR